MGVSILNKIIEIQEKTKEPQYQALLKAAENHGITKLGLMTNQVWNDDPRRLLILLSRYKFVSKMFSGIERVVEVGCGDAFGSRIVKQEVKELSVLDFDPIFIEDIVSRISPNWPLIPIHHDIISGKIPNSPYDAAYSLDVIEHIDKSKESLYLKNIVNSLSDSGMLIIGTPSLESQKYASEQSKIGHINCKSSSSLKNLLDKYFTNVFLFSMNDEVVHTGFYPMAHYYFALCSIPKK